MADMVAPAIDAKPGQPEVYYFDLPTRERVIAKRKETKAVAPAPAKKTAKRASKKATKKG